jgi:hypothetical protein
MQRQWQNIKSKKNCLMCSASSAGRMKQLLTIPSSNHASAKGTTLSFTYHAFKNGRRSRSVKKALRTSRSITGRSLSAVFANKDCPYKFVLRVIGITWLTLTSLRVTS